MKLVITILLSASVSAGVVYVWQSGEVDDVTAQLKQAQASATAVAQDDAQDAAELEELTDRLAELKVKLERVRAGRGNPVIAPPVVELDDGRYFGFIKAVTIDLVPPTFVVDLAEFFTGEEADQARARDGSPGEDLDYYIRNVNPLLRQLNMTLSVEITLSTWDRHNIPDPKKVDLATFERIFTAPKPWEQNVVRNGYWITVEDGKVVDLEEQYVP